LALSHLRWHYKGFPVGSIQKFVGLIIADEALMRREVMAVVGYDDGDASPRPGLGKRKAPGGAVTGRSTGEAEAVLHGDRIQMQRFPHEGGGDAFGGDLDQAIGLVRSQVRSLVANLQDAGRARSAGA